MSLLQSIKRINKIGKKGKAKGIFAKRIKKKAVVIPKQIVQPIPKTKAPKKRKAVSVRKIKTKSPPKHPNYYNPFVLLPGEKWGNAQNRFNEINKLNR